ncbi:hypothetical protein PtB15_3B97 [Puccinia triticina]|nr:hypothetical protein PtB15_3B97 [Puccinia triticina]
MASSEPFRPLKSSAMASPTARSPEKSAWAGLGLHSHVQAKLDQTPLRPDDLRRQTIHAILHAHHTHIRIPPATSTTLVLHAALQTVLRSHPTHLNHPSILLLATHPAALHPHARAAARLSHSAQPAQHAPRSLDADLQLARAPGPRPPICITTLPRAGLLLQHNALHLHPLAILVLDLRSPPALNHHSTAELRPLLTALPAHVQLVVLQSLNSHLPPALAALLDRTVERSIRTNLQATPDLSSSSSSAEASSSPALSLMIPSPPLAHHHHHHHSLPRPHQHHRQLSAQRSPPPAHIHQQKTPPAYLKKTKTTYS